MLNRRFLHFGLLAASLALTTCSSPSSNRPPDPTAFRRDPPPGFFDRLADQLTARECDVGRYTCPYGLGPANEPCECDDPRGYVLKGRTRK